MKMDANASILIVNKNTIVPMFTLFFTYWCISQIIFVELYYHSNMDEKNSKIFA